MSQYGVRAFSIVCTRYRSTVGTVVVTVCTYSRQYQARVVGHVYSPVSSARNLLLILSLYKRVPYGYVYVRARHEKKKKNIFCIFDEGQRADF